MVTTPYRSYLKYGARILSGYISNSFPNANIDNSRVQRLASFMAKNDDLVDKSAFKRYAVNFITNHVVDIKAKELMLLGNRSLNYLIRKIGGEPTTFGSKTAKAKYIARASNAEKRKEYYMYREFRRMQKYQSVYVPEASRVNREELEPYDMNEEFADAVDITYSRNERSINYTFNLEADNHDALVENMYKYLRGKILRNKNMSDQLKIAFLLDDGSWHYDYFHEEDMKYLVKKFSDKYWNQITNEIYPTEGSDRLILHISLLRLKEITFKIIKNMTVYHPDVVNNDKNGYKTNGGAFFSYLVKSKVDLRRFQIIPELNEENANLISEHCLIYALERFDEKQEKNNKLGVERINGAKILISRHHFKLTSLRELADLINVSFTVKYYTLDNNFNKSSGIKILNFNPTAEANQSFPLREVKLVVIADHYMIDEKIPFNKNYYLNKNEIKTSIKEIAKTKPKIAEEYNAKRHLFQKFNGKYMKFFSEDKLPKLSIYDVLHTLKDARKFKEINDANYFTCLNNIRYENIAEAEHLEEPNWAEFKKYTSMFKANGKYTPKPKAIDFIVFADFEASTDGDKHKPYCICARKYGVNTALNNEVVGNNIVSKTVYNIDDDFEIFESYKTDCAIDFLRWLENNSIVFFHNLTYDINFILKHVNKFKNGIVFHGRDMMHDVIFEGKNITFKDSLCMINSKLANFPEMFKLDSGEKEAFPYDYYSSANAFREHGNIREALEHVKPKDRDQFIKNIEALPGVKIDDNEFNMKKYALFYCHQDVRILAEGFIKFNKMCRAGLGIDCLNTISISGLANKYFEEHVYFKSDNIYKVGGPTLKFMMKTVYGGRCMVRDNSMYDINDKLVDFDAVSLYPSAVKRAYILEGKPTLIPKEWNGKYLLEHLFEDDQIKPTNDRFISGFFVKINITKIGKKLHMPLIVEKDEENKLTSYVNKTGVMYVNHITLQDLIKFQEIEFELIEGLYYYRNRNIECQKVIQYLFDQRKIYKAQKNPIEQTFKLVMNSVYGKTIMKPINYKQRLISGEENLRKYELKNYNYIKSIDKVEGEASVYHVKTVESLKSNHNLVQFGSIILSMSKRIISEVFCLAEELGHTVYYTDTDSGHFRASEINELAIEFEKRYGRRLIGTELGQFHCDFNNISNDAGMPESVKSKFLGKKSYIDMLLDDKNNLAFHVRMKGIPADTLERTANDMFRNAIKVHCKNGLFVPEKNEGVNAEYSIFKLYDHLYKNNAVTFELVSEYSPCFEFNKNRTVTSRKSFSRKICFKIPTRV